MFAYINTIKIHFYICFAHLVFLFLVLIFELHNLVLFFVSKLNLNLSLTFVLIILHVFNTFLITPQGKDKTSRKE